MWGWIGMGHGAWRTCYAQEFVHLEIVAIFSQTCQSCFGDINPSVEVRGYIGSVLRSWRKNVVQKSTGHANDIPTIEIDFGGNLW